jgi:hypothetical protein
MASGRFDILKNNNYMAEKVVRTNEALWVECKKEAVESMGKFSARAMQRAVVLYKERGGEYIGVKSKSNPLVAWSKEQEGKKRAEFND